MAKRPWKTVVDNAVAAYKSGDYVYLYGAKNVRLTSESQIRGYFSREPAYFSKFSADELNQIVRNSLGHMADDCSGFTGWVCTGDQQYSIGQINNCYKCNTLQAGPTGSILFTTWGGTGRHIGLDVGGGLCMHIGWESTDAAIREGRAGILFEPIANRAWEKSGQSNVVDYSGAYSPYEPVTALWNSIHGGSQPGPKVDTWVGETYGKALVDVYAQPKTGTLLSAYPYLAVGNLFEVLKDAGNFWEIRIASKYTGYIEKKYCLRKTKQRDATVSVNLNLRQNAGPNYKSLCVMPKGAKVELCDTKAGADGKNWCYIRYNGIYGFCASYYVK